jgi:glycosyltransferase involved in cell wall biosynthesis
VDEKLLKDFPSVELVNTPLLNRKSPLWFSHKILQRILPRDFLLEQLLAKHDISVLSHSGTLGRNSPIKTIAWIPDFQHKHLTVLFKKVELKYRDQIHTKYCRESTCLLLSSYDALNDLKIYYPGFEDKTKVLHFVAGPLADLDLPDIENLGKKYKFNSPYFHLPNQFWAHKNHKVVIEALRILKEKGIKVIVILTGRTEDPRQSDLYNSLMAKVEAYNLSDSFLPIGVVPYNELISLMRKSIALINPSLFEGWSSTVEEAKSIGKRIILSDIPIHREQSPPGGLYFNPDDPEMLANQMKIIIDSNSAEEKKLQADAERNLMARKLAFAEKYQKIVLDTLNILQ